MTTHYSLASSLFSFDPDAIDRPAVALQVQVEQKAMEQPVHQHHKGQLILALRGGVTCQAPSAMWMVPPSHAVWIPGGIPHSSHATPNAHIYFLLIEKEAAPMPSDCCTLAIAPHVREMICYLAEQDPLYIKTGATARLVEVLLEQLVNSPTEQLNLPISNHPKIRLITKHLLQDPSNRATISQWAQQLAMSDRTFARLFIKETGLSFGRWRQQLLLLTALQQLAAGNAVQTVAGNLGYQSVSAFITMFKKALGHPPSRYFSALH